MKRDKPKTRSVILMCDYSLSFMGGAQTAFIRQAMALLSQGWRVIVVAPHAKEAFQELGSPLLTVIEPSIRITLPGVGLPLLKKLSGLEKRLHAVIETSGVDAFILHSEFALAGMALRIGKARELPVLHTVHTFFWTAPVLLGTVSGLVTMFHMKLTGLPKRPTVKEGTRIERALRSMTLRVAARSDGVLSPSKHQAEKLREAGLTNVHVLSNVVQEVKDVTQEASPDVLNIFWAARFAPEKRVGVALESQRIVAKRLGPGKVILHVAGGSADPQPDTVFHGKISQKEVTSLLRTSDAALITSSGFDNQPMFALEAFANSKPLITVDPKLKEEFGDAALLSEDDTPQSLATLIVGLHKDGSRIVTASEHAKAYARERSAEKHAEKLRELI